MAAAASLNAPSPTKWTSTPAGAAPAANTDWLQVADVAAGESMASLPAVDGRGENIQAWWVSPVVWYAGKTWGWADGRTEALLRRLYAKQTPSGGYGLGQAWDWGGDGTTNKASTSYSITTAWHVGRTLIDGYDDGGIPKERVLSAVTSLLNTPTTSGGRCIAYSDAPHDATKPCVWNINATAAWFLWQAYQRGLVPSGRDAELLDKARTWRDFTKDNFRWDIGAWSYREGSDTLQDAWHNAATVGPIYELDRTVGVAAMAGQFRIWPDNAANADLVIYDCSKIAPGLVSAVRMRAFPSFDTQRERLETRSRWAYTALRVHRACFAAANSQRK
jgi:hypothetical protein